MSEPIPSVVAASKVEAVVLFEDRAEVTRSVELLPTAAGQQRVRIEGLSELIDGDSLRVASASPGLVVVSARVEHALSYRPGLEGEALAQLERQELDARLERDGRQRAVQAAEQRGARTRRLVARWQERLVEVPRPADQGGMESTHAELLAQEEADGVALTRARAALDAANLELRRLGAQLEEARQLVPTRTSGVVAQVARTDAEAGRMSLSYRLPCAVWRPEHLARLGTVEAGKATVDLTTWATCWNRSGEDWKQVPLRFSTARPGRIAEAPLQSDDVLHLRRKSPQERSTVVVEARDEAVQLAGLGHGTRDVSEMPGVDDGGEPLQFEALLPTDLPSHGRPVRVEIGRQRLHAQVERLAFPERSSVAHLRATSTLTGRTPLLAGPVWVARGEELAGRGRTDFVAAGEPFELGFGAEEQVRVQRLQTEKRETTPIIGTQKLTRTIELFLSNLGDAPLELSVIERLPISEVEQLRVELLQPAGAQPSTRDGRLTLPVKLAAHGEARLLVSYRIEASAKVVLPF